MQGSQASALTPARVTAVLVSVLPEWASVDPGVSRKSGHHVCVLSVEGPFRSASLRATLLGAQVPQLPAPAQTSDLELIELASGFLSVQWDNHSS